MTRTSRLPWLLLAIAATAAAPAFADDYLVYTDAGIPGNGSDVWVWCENQNNPDPCPFAEFPECANPEGSRKFRMQGTNAWMGFGVFHNIDPGPDGIPATGDEFATPVDLSAFLGGELRFFVKSNVDLSVEMQCEVGGNTKGAGRALSATNWDGTNTWQEIVIPLTDFNFGAGPPVNLADCLSAVLSPFMSTAANLTGFNEFQIDGVRWRVAGSCTTPPCPPTTPATVEVSGRELMVNGEPFVVNGVAYTPISIGEDWRGALRDRPDRYDVDFPLIAASGANVVRTYSTFLTTRMLDEAWRQGLYVIPTFTIDVGKLKCDTGREFMRDRFRDAVTQWKDHPAILGWLVGNEVNTRGRCSTSTMVSCQADVDCPGAETCSVVLCDATTGWYSQLENLAKTAHIAEGGGTCSLAATACVKDDDCPGVETCEVAAGAMFHPVGTANADNGLADICAAGCSDDGALPNLDFWGVQIYRGCGFGTVFSDYAAKASCGNPLIVTEFGADAYDSVLGAENENMQLQCLATQLLEAEQALAIRSGGVSSGQVIFEWTDEWWKAFPLTPPQAGFCDVADGTEWFTHDTCASWQNNAYPDAGVPNMNEEWWGITGVASGNPLTRNLRSAHSAVNAFYQLGAVNDMEIASFDPGTGNLTVSFTPGAGSTDHTVHYGPLSAVSTYGYTGSAGGLGANGMGSATLPAGDLFWVVVGRNSGAEGCYGKDSACVERPVNPGAAVPLAANRTCSVPLCP